MNQPNKDDRNNPMNQSETGSTGHQTGSSQTTNKNRGQGQGKEQNVHQDQTQKGNVQQQPVKANTENTPQKKEHSAAG
jgi:hypothetical protein